MPDSSYVISLKHALWNLLAGTRGGVTRIRIIMLLRERPYNMNQLHERLSLDYKTVQHHIKVMLDERIITTTDSKKYGSMYFLSPLIEENPAILDEILDKTGEKKIKGKNKRGL